MIFETNIKKIMALFLREPLKDFHLREIERNKEKIVGITSKLKRLLKENDK